MATGIMVVAGEPSGDMHGANLVRSLKRIVPDLDICGMGGSAMREAGVDILVDNSRVSVVGLVEILTHFADIRAAHAILVERLKTRPPILLVLIDFPEFNFLLAAKAKKLAIPIFYYVSPQVWAWRRGRVKKIRRLVDRMAVILPFEKDFYQKHGVDVDFVGHPLVDELAGTVLIPRDEFIAAHDLDPATRNIGILPGSRRREVGEMLPHFVAACRQLQEKTAIAVNIILPLAPGIDRQWVRGIIPDGIRVLIVPPEERYSSMAACDAVIAASGPVTLELALLGTPAIVAYRVAPLTYLVGMLLIKTEFFSLVNLIAGEKVVEELLQQEVNADNLVAHLERILSPEENKKMRRRMAEVARILGGPGASDRAAAAALATIRGRDQGDSARTALMNL